MVKKEEKIKDLSLDRPHMSALTHAFQEIRKETSEFKRDERRWGKRPKSYYPQVFKALYYPDEDLPRDFPEDPRWRPFLKDMKEFHKDLEGTRRWMGKRGKVAVTPRRRELLMAALDPSVIPDYVMVESDRERIATIRKRAVKAKRKPVEKAKTYRCEVCDVELTQFEMMEHLRTPEHAAAHEQPMKKSLEEVERGAMTRAQELLKTRIAYLADATEAVRKGEPWGYEGANLRLQVRETKDAVDLLKLTIKERGKGGKRGSPESQVRIAAIKALEEAEEVLKARKWEEDLEMSRILAFKAEGLIRLEMYADARTDLKEALKLNPGNEKAQYLLDSIKGKRPKSAKIARPKRKLSKKGLKSLDRLIKKRLKAEGA